MDNLNRKNILLYFNDPLLEKLAEEQNWSGEVKAAAGDYLMVVDANLAALKTDAVIKRNITYKVNYGNNGIFADLAIGYSHQGNFDWRTTTYRSFVRIYVPAGSELVSAEGENVDGVTTGSEFNKTVFSAFITVAPQTIGTLHLRYKLPAFISNQIKEGSYQLYCQKQPGKNVTNLSVNTQFNESVANFAPAGFYAQKLDDRTIDWETDFKTDKLFTVNF
jgi:hypothetical protein